MKIKHKLYGLTALSLFALISIVLITEIANIKLLKEEKVLVNVKALEVSLLDLNRLELEFLISQDSNKLNEFNGEAAKFEANLAILKTQLLESKLTISSLSKLHQEIKLYEKDFAALVTGYGKDAKQDQYLIKDMKLLFDDIMSIFINIEQTLEQDINANQQAIERTILTSVTLVTIVLVALSVWVSNGISSRLQALSDTMQNVSDTHDLSLKTDVSGSDEITTMSGQFNTLLESMQTLIHSVKTTINELSTASSSLQQSSSKTSEAQSQQQLEIDSVATAMTEMGETIREVASTTDRAASNTKNSFDSAQKGLSEIEATKNTISTLAQELDDAGNEVSNLSQLSAKISSVLDVIRDIAEQTNLLALNAAIEAARAGEQGRGFAVVADEVRTLASRTQSSTQEITEIIQSVHNQTERVVNSMGVCHQEGKNSTHSSDAAFDQVQTILTDMQQILDSSTQIASAVEEQSLVSEEVARNINNIRDIALENTKAIQLNTESSKHVEAQAVSLSEVISRFKV
ncbi:methyl-accepting chemotaxis protein [Vibrio sp. SCSIO 43136]|uniref:methyl-accepting chemotaxis protein n=1 Tax=Vibrio sp. SCSIO 43136 TaxID=2819101 RepID=UPI002075E074|nr:methyl-accepting chemotaxis protein [Vibrio sp. SCSIO 43136]USD66959.1 HAMP domain-containing protein [Vibrio sp. SCSIO 43136]